MCIYIASILPTLVLNRQLMIEFQKSSCGGGILAVAGLQGDNNSYYLGAKGGKQEYIYISSILPNQGCCNIRFLHRAAKTANSSHFHILLLFQRFPPLFLLHPVWELHVIIVPPFPQIPDPQAIQFPSYYRSTVLQQGIKPMVDGRVLKSGCKKQMLDFARKKSC